MTTFQVSTTIDKPVGIVVKALMNPANFVYWTTDLVRFEVIERRPGEVGSIAHLHYSKKGKTYVMEDKLISCKPGEKYVSEVTGDFLAARVETTLISYGDKTEINMQWEGKGKTFFLMLLLPLIRGKISKNAEKELETFRKLVETRGSDFNNE